MAPCLFRNLVLTAQCRATSSRIEVVVPHATCRLLLLGHRFRARPLQVDASVAKESGDTQRSPTDQNTHRNARPR